MDKRKCFVFDAVSFSGHNWDIRKFLLLICFEWRSVYFLAHNSTCILFSCRLSWILVPVYRIVILWRLLWRLSPVGLLHNWMRVCNMPLYRLFKCCCTVYHKLALINWNWWGEVWKQFNSLIRRLWCAWQMLSEGYNTVQNSVHAKHSKKIYEKLQQMTTCFI
jgi:hypothetical protein